MQADFFGRGTFPPNAVHSEGHQDSMGICLFLALNEELAGGICNLVVLDDVMMSIDAGHRKAMCALLRTQFPHKQLVITTHDRAWAKMLRQEGVVRPEDSYEFFSWSLDTGPIVRGQQESWDEIDRVLAASDVRSAAFHLRRSSEAYFEAVCDALGATVVYNSAWSWQLEHWLSAARERYRELVGSAIKVAVSWGLNEQADRLRKLDQVRKQVFGRVDIDQWEVNAAVHHNNWENFTAKDFESVVAAFKDLWKLFACGSCHGLLKAIPADRRVEIVKCNCGATTWNLKTKPTA